ncbi:NAD(P)-dependent short-chain dehydrogenase [Pontimonas salivibrio]|uniref:NAD(P)-dependent short-chain dehydrogenase n=1 Tax=Pontimonas salivibrio TaxID=1159327 RepID=A0A2L2BNL4_9MICO|nr:glucose 1-dehydrogenase [Pontimonas salivibrio]AVG23256.1 NAD(P)-dependent short-chain dehydrogenase [Pontimonas salivibrio]
MTQEFTGKTVLVTGGGSGIGEAVALQLGREGANVAVADIDLAAAEAVAKKVVDAGGSAQATAVDVGDPEAVKAMVDWTVKTFGHLHGAFNNAGIGGPTGLPEDIDIAEYHKLMDVNLHSVFYGIKYQAPEIVKSGGGSIVNTSSILGLVGEGGFLPYVTAKHALVGMTKASALAYAAQGVRVNSVHPGYINTPLLANNLDAETMAGLVTLHPVGRLGESEEVAEVVCLLLSDKSSFVTGSQYVVDGGYVTK